MCTNQCEENCFCHVKKRPCDPFYCQCKPESCQNPIKRLRASEVTTSTAPVPNESTKIEEEVKVNMGIETIRATTKNFRLEGEGGIFL